MKPFIKQNLFTFNEVMVMSLPNSIKQKEDCHDLVTEQDRSKLDAIETWKCFYCYATNTFIENRYLYRGNTMGQIVSSGTKYEMSDDGVIINIIYWQWYKRARFPHIKPDYSKIKYHINLIEKSVTS